MQAPTGLQSQRVTAPGTAPHGRLFNSAPGAQGSGATVTLRHFLELKHKAELRQTEIPRVLGIRFFEGPFDDARRVLVDIENAGWETPAHLLRDARPCSPGDAAGQTENQQWR
jgi:hypothetical protein